MDNETRDKINKALTRILYDTIKKVNATCDELGTKDRIKWPIYFELMSSISLSLVVTLIDKFEVIENASGTHLVADFTDKIFKSLQNRESFAHYTDDLDKTYAEEKTQCSQ